MQTLRQQEAVVTLGGSGSYFVLLAENLFFIIQHILFNDYFIIIAGTG